MALATFWAIFIQSHLFTLFVPMYVRWLCLQIVQGTQGLGCSVSTVEHRVIRKKENMEAQNRETNMTGGLVWWYRICLLSRDCDGL
jgi:hypothetical protein